MHYQRLGLLLCLLGSAIGSTFRQREIEARQRRLQAASAAATDISASSPDAAPQFLNSKTSKYSVNGSSLPFVNFNIGESYAGLLPIDNTGRELFFWFFPSSSPKNNDKITIWLNGGPGCSSMEGFFEENGKVVFRPGTYGPINNPYAYNKLSSVVWIDQPVGTGFSQGKPNATNEVEVAKQFNGFWKNFVELFDLQHKPIYLTGESYAGQYVPYIADGMVNKSDTTYYNVKGILVYDPVIDPGYSTVAFAVPFAELNLNNFPFAPSVWANLRERQESCGHNRFIEQALQYPPKGPIPDANRSSACDLYDDIYYQITGLNACFNIYHVTDTCPTLGDIIGGPGSSSGSNIPALRQAYFNRADVKKALHVSPEKSWSECSPGVLNQDTSPISGAQNGPIKRVAEATKNVIIGHGTQDYILLANSSLVTLNNLTWSGSRGFDEPPNKPFYVPSGFNRPRYTYTGSWTASRGITFVYINLSGHMVPEFQPGASYRHLEYMFGKVKSLDAKQPFTT